MLFQMAPIIAIFFLWGLGTGAQQLARPLFAFSFGVPIFLVTLIESYNALARIISAPTTGFLTDRFGRKPLVISGVAIRGTTTFIEFFVTSYTQFLILEFIGALGVAMGATSSQILLADVAGERNRGRMVALRTISSRAGMALGPVVGGMIAAAYSLRAAILFNGFTKIAVVIIAIFLIRETRPEATGPGANGQLAKSPPLDYRLFLTRTFIALAIATLAFSMMTEGIYKSLMPLYAQEDLQLSVSDIGRLIGIGGLLAIATSLPNGLMMDRVGRKVALVPGLALLGVASYLVGISGSFQALIVVAIVYGIAESMTRDSTQVFAIDMAPPDRRGSFLVVWFLFTHAGGFIVPL
ncbi:MAG: MFS transporter, partial [Chloroflexi bacterium]|nr:MFS transporter [Chloroflexota bacterium]